MSATEPQPGDEIQDLGLAAASALQAAMPVATTWDIAPTEPAIALPGADARAVRATAGAVTVLLVVDAALARQLQVGPPPAEDLLDGARPGLDAAAAALGAIHGGAPLSDLEEVDPAPAIVADRSAQVAAVALVEDGTHRATLLVSLPAAAEAAIADELPARQPATRKLTSVPSGLEMLHDVEMGVTAELGRTRMLVRDVLDLLPGSVIELDRSVGSPVDVLVNGTLIARGEVVVIDEEFGIRITEVIGYQEDRLG